MNKATILENVLAKKGQFGSVVINKPLKNRAGVKHDVRKITKMVIRAGINYDNLTVVKEKRESGKLPPVNAGLPFGSWVAYPYLIHHKGNHYIRLYPASSKTEYLLDGKPTDIESIKHLVLASEVKPNHSDCITVNINNIQELV